MRADGSVCFIRDDNLSDSAFGTFGYNRNQVYLRDLDAHGNLTTPDIGLPRHVNDSFLYWRSD